MNSFMVWLGDIPIFCLWGLQVKISIRYRYHSELAHRNQNRRIIRIIIVLGTKTGLRLKLVSVVSGS